MLLFLIGIGGSVLAQDVNDLIREARQAYEQGDLQAADSAYTAAITADEAIGNNAADLFYNRGTVRLEADRYEAAAADFAQALSRAASGSEIAVAARYNSALVDVLRGRYEEAIRAFTTIVDQASDSDGSSHGLLVSSLVNRGIAYYESGSQAEASADFETAIELQPSNARAHYNLGNLAFDQENFERAVARYSSAIDADSDYMDAYLNRARARIALEDYEAAAADLEEVLNRESNNGEAQELRDAITEQES